MIFHIEQKINNPLTPFVKGESGLSIVATVLVLLALALFAAVAVSLVTTGTGTGIQEERGVEAFYIADGGMQYTLKKNTYPYYDGDYDPPLSDSLVTDISLGDGSFSVTVPTLSGGINTTEAIGNNLSSTEGFSLNLGDPTNYWVLICGATGSPRPVIKMSSSDCEKISCNADFSTCTRGRDSTDAAAHPSNSVVMMYSWTTTHSAVLGRDFPKGAKCNNKSSMICLNDTTGFAPSGFIRIHYTNAADENYIEDVFYDGIGTGSGDCGPTCTTGCLGKVDSGNGCVRSAFDGGGNGTATHSATTNPPTIYQSEFSVIVTSEGKTPGVIILQDIKRVLQTNVLPLKDP